jgi:YD repeat-containing protein
MMKDASGEKRYSWDDGDRLLEVKQGPASFTTNWNYSVQYTWNAASQRTIMDVFIGPTSSRRRHTYTYTDDDQLASVTNPDSETTALSYLKDGRLKKYTLANGATRELFYQDTDSSHAYVADKNTHLRATLDKKSGGTVICSFDYELDPAGNRLGVEDKDGKYTHYAQDPTYQLKTETKWSAKTPGTRSYQYAYNYDPNGNRIEEWHDGVLRDFTYGDNNEMLSAGFATFAYDEFANLISETAGGTTTNFVWDSFGGLTSVTDGSSTDTHQYDADRRRMRSKFNNAAAWTNYVYDELETSYAAIIAEYTEFGGTYTVASVNTHAYGLVSNNRAGTKRYFHFDGDGSTVALTDGSEVVQDTYSYSAFGVQEAASGSSVNALRYLGLRGAIDSNAAGSTFSYYQLGILPYLPTLGFVLLRQVVGPASGADYKSACAAERRRRDDLCEKQFTDCLGTRNIISAGAIALCVKICKANPWCLLGCLGLSIWAIFKLTRCLSNYEDCLTDSERKYQECLRRHGPPPPWVIDFVSCVRDCYAKGGTDCWAKCWDKFVWVGMR